ncbi:hypothetical protein Pen02_21520 [Plantactinospora endophytica]|uniref:Uncharacterized protein n=1 Tax=Plantactinospora endophytica TaxID=673535 RepID=A0ABQ4DXP8_9ACTN|nr:hypothetical protein Pen02_21520 [Plantactinospora endophytica]
MNGHESAPGLAADWAWATITNHAEGRHCNGCRGIWCPTAEWSLWVVITDRIIPVDRRPLVTVVARQVMIAHWPRTVDGCRPCGVVGSSSLAPGSKSSATTRCRTR